MASRLKVRNFYWLLAAAILANTIAVAWLLLAGPGGPPSLAVAGAMALTWAAAAASFVLWIARPAARLSQVALSEILPRAGALETAVSAFASGNMVVRAKPKRDGADDHESAIEEARDSLDAAISDFNSITAPPSKRICFTGCNSYEEGRVAGSQIERLLGGKGRVIGLIPSWGQVNHALRLKGCANYLAEIHSGITIASVRETSGAIDRAESLAKELFAHGSEYDLLYITDGFTPQAFCKVLREGGAKQARRPKIVTFDVIEENVALLGSGEISCLIEQNMYAQTFNALVHLFNALESGWKPVAKKIFQPPMVVEARNIGEYWNAGQKLRTITEDERRLLAEPLRRCSGKRLKLGLALPTTGGFAQGLENGARAAKVLLSGYGADVEIVNAFRDWRDFGMASAFAPVFEAFSAKGFDGIATCVFDAGIVPLINAASDKGVAVTTYNSEPSNFRELIENIIDNIRHLAESSQDVAASAEEGSRANQQITRTIEGIESGIADQRDRIAGSDTELRPSTRACPA